MGSKTKIEWTDATWNPVIGCSRVSEGCRNCYAETIAGRFGQGKQTVYSGLTQIANGRPAWTGKIVQTQQLLDPLRWRRPKRVFVNSMSNLFHPNVSEELCDRIFGVMVVARLHVFQVLTKRPGRMKEYLEGEGRYFKIQLAAEQICREAGRSIDRAAHRDPSFLEHIWLGVSVENQEAADERIPLLLHIPASVLFVSIEPLLGPVDIGEWIGLKCEHDTRTCAESCPYCEGLMFLDWVICGGESGPHARPMHPAWARSLRDQCSTAGVPFFFKQWGEWTPGENVERTSGVVRGAHWFDGDWSFGPEDLAYDEGHRDDEPDLYLVGKKAAGALLDGREWKQFPKV